MAYRRCYYVLLLRRVYVKYPRSFTEYVQNTFYNQLFEAAHHVSAHTDELDTRNRQVDRADVPEMMT